MHRSHFTPTLLTLAASSSNTRRTRVQSSLEVQHRREKQQQRKITEYFSAQSQRDAWIAALNTLQERSESTGVAITEESLVPSIRAASSWSAAKHIYFNIRKKILPRHLHHHRSSSSSDGAGSSGGNLGLAMMDAAAKHGKWQFALSFLSRNRKNSTSCSRSEEGAFQERLLKNAIASLSKSSAATSAPFTSSWAVALAVTAVMRNPQKRFEFRRRDLFGGGGGGGGGEDNDDNKKESGGVIVASAQPASVPSVAASPALIENLVSLLADQDRWLECLALLRAAERQHIHVSPALLEHVARVCYANEKHAHVAAIAHQMISSDLPIREQIARLCLRSLESVAASAAGGAHHHSAGGGRRGYSSTFATDSFRVGSDPASASLVAVPSPDQHWQNALKIFNALADQGLALTRQTYESPLRCCAVSGRWVEAARVIGEMRRDGLQAGQHNLETVLCAKISHGCGSAAEAYRVLKAALPSSPEHSSGIIEPRTARAFNASLAAAVREGDRRTVSAVLNHMRRAEVPRDRDTQKWLVRAAFNAQRWELVLRHFLFLRKEILADVERAEKHGYLQWPDEYALDDDIARMVLEACEMIGLGDDLARNVAEAVLEAKRREFNDDDDDDVDGGDGARRPKLLAAGGADEKGKMLRDLAKRADSMKRRLRRLELGELASIPGEQHKKQQRNTKHGVAASSNPDADWSSSGVGDVLNLSNKEEADLFSSTASVSGSWLRHYEMDVPEVPK